MKKFKLKIFMLFSSYILQAQVGIGTTNPQAALDITATTDGLLVPRVALFDTVTPTIDTPTQSELVYNTATSGIAPNNVTPGFYYWDGLKWLRIKSSTNNSDTWSLDGNSGTVDANNFIGTTDDVPFNIRVANQKAGRITSGGDVFFGYQAGNVNTGASNTGIGYRSLFSNTTGTRNTATGLHALRINTTGSNNTATGTVALYSNTTGTRNTANGDSALFSNTTGTNNTATGTAALGSNTTGTKNTANGDSALYSNTTGTNNTATGNAALGSNTTGTRNTANGDSALFSNTTGTNNTATGTAALIFNTTGTRNTANGDSALFSNTTGTNNTATGNAALIFNTTGSSNTAHGDSALYSNSTGSYNTATGTNAMFSNTTGYENTATGVQALRNNTTGFYNSAMGHNSLFSNTTGNYNTANGHTALYANTTGSFNTAKGYAALYYNTTGGNNTAIGSYALFYNTTGISNTAVGSYALYANTTGGGNTAFGSGAGFAGTAIITGSNNTFIGNSASSDSAIRVNSIAIAGNGNLAFGGDNRVRIGNNAMTSIGGQVGWTTISDQRVKDNIRQDVKGLDFILKLKPLTYTYSIEKSNQIQKSTIADEWPSKHNIEKIRFSGFLAQEVEKTAKEVGYDFSGVDKPEDADGLWGLRYSEFTVPLVKAVQELSAQNKQLQESNTILVKQLEDLLQKMKEQEKRIQLLEKKI